MRAGAVRFRACSSYAHHLRPSNAQRHYEGQIDFFGVHCPATAGVYLIPIEHLQVKVEGALRIEAPRNAQRRRIRNADEYLIARVTLDAGRPRQLELRENLP